MEPGLEWLHVGHVQSLLCGCLESLGASSFFEMCEGAKVKNTPSLLVGAGCQSRYANGSNCTAVSSMFHTLSQ
eukprot:4494298-Amphidinium_carterae.1